MNPKTLRTLSVTGIVASLLIAASPAWAQYGRHYGYGPRYVHPYRAAVVVAPMVSYGYGYGYAPPPVYYTPSPAYAPAYYAPPLAYVPAPAYYGRLPLRMHRLRTGRR
jgi:hypothetical protein